MKPLRSIEALRAWMAWWVVVGHGLHLIGVGGDAALPDFLTLVPDQIIAVLLRGDVAVSVFIIVSGFVITHLRLTRPEPWVTYIGRRFLRLFPVYAVCMAAAIALSPLYAMAYIDSGIAFGTEMRAARLASEADQLPLHLLLHVSMIHGAVPDTVLPYAGSAFLAPAWSLSLEWQFYLIAPALFSLLALRGLTTLMLSVGALALVQLLLTRQTAVDWQYDSLFFLASGYFLIGMLCRIAIERIARQESPFEYLLLAMILMLSVDRLAAVLWLIWFGIVLYEAGYMRIESRLFRRLVQAVAFDPRLARLGQWSYATYLAHIPVFSLLVGGYGMSAGAGAINQEIAALIVISSFPMIVLISAGLHRHVELPAIRLGKIGLQNKRYTKVTEPTVPK